MKFTRRPLYGPGSADGPGELEGERQEPQHRSERDGSAVVPTSASPVNSDDRGLVIRFCDSFSLIPAFRLLGAERFRLQPHAGSGTRFRNASPISAKAYPRVSSPYRIEPRRRPARRCDRYVFLSTHAPNDPA
jgi:hypothetical protein